MTYVPYDNILPEVTPYCAGVPDEVAINAIRNATIEFCDKTHWLQYSPAALTGTAGQATYAFATPTDTLLARIVSLWYDNFELTAASEDQLDQMVSVEWRILQGSPRYYTHPTDATIVTLAPYPLITEVGAITSMIVLKPTRASTTLDPDLAEKWTETIAAGARMRLHSTPGQSYTSNSQAAVASAMFRSGISDAIVQRNRGMTRAPLVMRPPTFF